MLRLALAALAAGLGLVTAAAAEAPASLPPNDYARAEAWLCRPDKAADPCREEAGVTTIAADGAVTPQTLRPDPAAPVDCFYVYPTISRDPEILSDMTPGPEEAGVAAVQAAPFASLCRVYAPMYRQLTVASIRLVPRGAPRPPVTFEDVRAAWRYYLDHDNHGRGVVLIGHSQGSRHIARLLEEEIEGKPVASRLISALVIGYNLPVREGEGLGALKSTPLCKAAGQTGCVIAYMSFADSVPPAPTARFGRPETPAPGLVSACVNPAALAGGEAVLHPYMSNGSRFASPPQGFDWGAKGPAPSTPYVALPGWIAARCAVVDGAHVLQVRLDRQAGDVRPPTIPGHLMNQGAPNPEWGLHMVDINLALGDLLDVVRNQRDAWLAHAKAPAS